MGRGEILNYIYDDDTIDLSYIQNEIEMKKRKEYLAQHPYEIWQGSDGLWHTYFPDEEKGRVPRKRKDRTELEDLIVKYWREKEESLTIEDVFNEWNNRRLSLGKIKKSTYTWAQKEFKRHYTEMGQEQIREITPEEIEDFLEEEISRQQLSAKAFSNLKVITKGFLKYAKHKKYICFPVQELFEDMDVSDRSFKKTIKEDYEEVFNDEEMELIIDYLTDNLDLQNLGILLMFVTGIRVGELVALKHEDFDGNAIKIRRTETLYKDESGHYVHDVDDYPKTKAGVRTVIIPQDYIWLADKIRHTNAFGEYVFCRNGKRIYTSSIRRRLSIVCKNLGIYHKSPHKVRKTYGSILLDNNVDQRLVVELMGHSNVITTEQHYHRNRRSINAKAARINSIPEFAAK